ncbi:MAG: metallopeptidase [Candidatus Brockarchaeota archaeon]|nr:metallopeptidase [Candidatus Brockarchaeota archaeon]
MPTYSDAPDVKELVDEFIESLDLYHIDKKRVLCVRSKGSKAGGTLARIHSFPKVYQKALGMRPVYIIEVISENFDKIEEAEKESFSTSPRAFREGCRTIEKILNRK